MNPDDNMLSENSIKDEVTVMSNDGNSISRLVDVINMFENTKSYYDIHKYLKSSNNVDITKYMFLLNQSDENTNMQIIKSLSRKQIEEVLFDLPRLLEIFSETRITPLFKYRYRRYMFRILYLLWQDYYDKTKYHNLFLYVLNHPKSQEYVKEVNFTVDQLRSLVLSKQVENKLLEMARTENLEMRVFLSKHQINRDSVIAIDAIGIFFLFCSADDYLEIGSERLIIALMRSEIRNQAKIFNNMMKKLTKEELLKLKEVLLYFEYKYDNTITGKVQEFWNLISQETREIYEDAVNFTQEEIS